MKKKTLPDQEEETLVEEYERGAFKPVKNQAIVRKDAIEAALHAQGRPNQYSIVNRRP
jgi:hypothetical protein